MAKRADTVTVATTSTAVTCPTDVDWLKVKNIDTANGVWVNLDGTATSATSGGADEHEYIGPGEAILVPYARIYYMIATGGTPQVNVVTAAGRI